MVGRNGMGKTTLCNAIMGLVPVRGGSIRFNGEELAGLPPYKIAAAGIGYCPQGRRLWSSLTVDEHLRLMDGGGAWSVSRIYGTFPRLEERRHNSAAQLSGGEQQMLAISRALLQDPELLILDEPTEGLAPVIVDQLQKLLLDLAGDPQMSILLIEQNISVATAVSKDVAIMVNGRIGRVMPSEQLANDRTLQERLLGVGRHSHEDVSFDGDSDGDSSVAVDGAAVRPAEAAGATGKRTGEASDRTGRADERTGEAFDETGRADERTGEAFDRTGRADKRAGETADRTGKADKGRGEASGRIGRAGKGRGEAADRIGKAGKGTGGTEAVGGAGKGVGKRAGETEAGATALESAGTAEPSSVRIQPPRWTREAWQERGEQINSKQPLRPFDSKPEPVYKETRGFGTANVGQSVVLLAGTFDTKGRELNFIRDCLNVAGVKATTVDLSTGDAISRADVPPHIIAGYHPGGSSAVFSNDRGASVKAMSSAFANWIRRQGNVAGIISAGGSGGTALAAPAMRALPVGVPKVMISTVASGDVSEYVGPSDIFMLYSVTDIQGLNRISKKVLANGANALAGMVRQAQQEASGAIGPANAAVDKPGLGITMFGVTTPAVRQIVEEIEDDYDCLVFHATGTGGRSMEKLVDGNMLAGAIDITTTEVCDMLVGGVMAADEDRFGAFIRTGAPWVGSVGAVDMVNFGARDSIPGKFRDRQFIEHNPQVTLMRTTVDENKQVGSWIAGKVNQMSGPVRLLLPEGGVSALDAPGQPFHLPEANRALFDAIRQGVEETSERRVVLLPCHINDPEFAAAAVAAFREITYTEVRRSA